jgi:hypothetical protein
MEVWWRDGEGRDGEWEGDNDLRSELKDGIFSDSDNVSKNTAPDLPYGPGVFITYNPTEVGPCQFDAIAHQLAVLNGKPTDKCHKFCNRKLTHLQLRNEVVQFLRDNPYSLDGITHLNNFTTGSSWEGYLESMAKVIISLLQLPHDT